MKNNFRTYNLAVEFYRNVVALSCPVHLSDQLARAASSVAFNLAEGSGRQSRKDKLRFFHIAFGSVRECQAGLDLAGNAPSELLTQLDSLAAHTYRLIQNTAGE